MSDQLYSRYTGVGTEVFTIKVIASAIINFTTFEMIYTSMISIPVGHIVKKKKKNRPEEKENI